MGDGNDRIAGWGQQLRATHRHLRNAIDLARSAIEADEDPDLIAGDLAVFCRGFCRSLDGHHRSEDRELFPMLRQHYPALGPVLHQLAEDHRVLAGLIDSFEASLRDGHAPDVLHRHLDGIEAILQTHFRYEERQLVSVLDRWTPTTTSESAKAVHDRLFGPIG